MTNKEINSFANKWLNAFSTNNMIGLNELQLGQECAALGFEMDAGKSFCDKFGHAFNDADKLAGVINMINDIRFLGTAIFSKWRYVTHWAEENLFAEKHCKWFAIAFAQLLELTTE